MGSVQSCMHDVLLLLHDILEGRILGLGKAQEEEDDLLEQKNDTDMKKAAEVTARQFNLSPEA